MFRHAFALKIKEGMQNGFRVFLGQIWPELTGVLDDLQISNFSLWSIDDLVFGYYETESELSGDEALQSKAASLWTRGENLYTWISSPAQQMRLMYQDFGVVRKSKELIRHRVFATHLKAGQQEEYKRRHDALVSARGDTVNPGPDSNFSIWNAGEYIFGYDEIDVTMETQETPASREETIAWETRMLEIMSWYTDDVDWITGERHHHIVRLAYHN